MSLDDFYGRKLSFGLVGLCMHMYVCMYVCVYIYI
jgi:hypothetical protein